MKKEKKNVNKKNKSIRDTKKDINESSVIRQDVMINELFLRNI